MMARAGYVICSIAVGSGPALEITSIRCQTISMLMEVIVATAAAATGKEEYQMEGTFNLLLMESQMRSSSIGL